MHGWRVAMLGCLLAVACGGPLPDELPPTGGQESESVASEPEAEADSGEESALACHPEVGSARRVKTILPPTDTIPRFAPVPDSLVDFRGRLYFAINFEDGHRALWRSSGTASGTIELESFPTVPPPLGSAPLGSLTPVGDQLFFELGDAVNGPELWVTDGSRGGARRVSTFPPEPGGFYFSHFTDVGGALVFFREVFGAPSGGHVEVWSSDGTPAGTVLLRDFGMTTVGFRDFRVGDALFFVLSDESRGTELWKTDGTSDGTVRVRRLDLGILYVSDAIAAGPAGFFTLEEFDGSTELWRTDGTTGGTVRLDAFGPAYLSPRFLGTLGRFLYFTVTDASAQRLVLYRRRVDGTGDRVRIVTLPNPYADEGSAFPYVELASQASGKIFFTLAIGSSGPAPRDTQLWVTNGTRSGTKLLRRPLSLSDEYSSPLLATGGLAFFAAYSPSVGIEPWVSDGTVSGTRRLKNVAPGSESSTPRSYTRVGRRVFFSAYDDTLAGQLWSVPLLHSCSFSGVEPALEETAAPRRE